MEGDLKFQQQTQRQPLAKEVLVTNSTAKNTDALVQVSAGHSLMTS